MTIDIATIGDNSGDLSLAQQIGENLSDKHADIAKRANDLAGMKDRAPKAVDNVDDADKISEAVRQCTAFLKIAKEVRVKEKEPYLEGGRAVDGWFNKLMDEVEKTKNILLRVRTDYDIAVETAARRAREEEAARARAEQERIAAEARAREEADRAAIAAANSERDRAAMLAAADARARADEERAAVAASRAEEAKEAAKVNAAELTRTRSDQGVTTSLRSEWVHEVIEPKKVPRKFCVPDDKLIRAAVKSATTKDGECQLEIAGVRIYKKHVSQVR